MTTVRDTEKASQKPRLKVNLSYFRDRSQRWWATWLFIVTGSVVSVAILANIFRDEPEIDVNVPSENKQLSLFADLEHPLATLGNERLKLYESGDSQIKLALIYEALEEFDAWMHPRIDSAFDRALSIEAKRMQEVAEKEALGTTNSSTIDALSLLDMNQCRTQIPAEKCVILRFAGEGIRDFYKAYESDNVYEMSNGYLRTRAALLALGEFEISSNVKQRVPLTALANYRQVVYLALLVSPVAAADLRYDMPQADGTTSPADALEQAYPNDRSTEPVNTSPTSTEGN